MHVSDPEKESQIFFILDSQTSVGLNQTDPPPANEAGLKMKSPRRSKHLRGGGVLTVAEAQIEIAACTGEERRRAWEKIIGEGEGEGKIEEVGGGDGDGGG